MKHVLAVIFTASVLSVSAASFATTSANGETKAFNCMDKKTFAINRACISQNIQDNLAFQKAEKAVLVNANNASDRALATMTFDNRTMTINIVAHKDATIASVDSASAQH